MADESFGIDSLIDQSNDDECETNVQSDKEEGKTSDDEVNNKRLIISISNVLSTILETNKKINNYAYIVRTQSKMIFSAKYIPNITIKDYLTRIQFYSRMEKSTLILSLAQIDHFCKKANLVLTYYNIHRILFTAILISIKYNEDKYYDNVFYSRIAGVELKELKEMEYSFLELSNFNVFVGHKEYEQYQKYLEEFEE